MSMSDITEVSTERLKTLPVLLETWAVPYLEERTMPFAKGLVADAAAACRELLHLRTLSALSTDTTEQPRSVQRRIAAQNGLAVLEFATGTGGRENFAAQQPEQGQLNRIATALNTPNRLSVESAKVLDDVVSVAVNELAAPAEQAGERLGSDARDVLAFIVNHCELPEWLYTKALAACAAPPLDAQKADTTQARDAWQPIETAPKDGLIDLCAGERIYSQCYYDSICDEYRRLDHWNRLEMLKLRNGSTHWRWSQLPPAAIAKETTK